MEYEIIEMYEQNNQLRILVDHKYGTDNIGLGLRAKKLHPETEEPRWKKEVNDLLEKKYGESNKKKIPIKEFIGKKFKLPKK